jgi:hypothetical protein
MVVPRPQALHNVAGPICPLVWALFQWELVGVVVWTGHWTFVLNVCSFRNL